jgi:hypothetical protein
MQFAQTKTRPTLKSVIKRAGICTLIVLTALGALVARTLFVERQVNADIQAFLCKKNASGGWDIIDQAKGPVSFKASAAGVLRGDITTGDINTKHIWSLRSEKGRQVSVNLEGAGTFSLNKANGTLEFALPFAANVDGKRIAQKVKISSASVSTPLGQKGKKIRIEGGSYIAEELVGLVTIEGGSVGIVEAAIQGGGASAKGAAIQGGGASAKGAATQGGGASAKGAATQGGGASAKGVAEKRPPASEFVFLILINAKAQ